ncbi:MAG TPA: DUF3626 domain-containing protein [Euzebya sp.]|nr:DUF3626 domain-containing protein [Euzebya sp.]
MQLGKSEVVGLAGDADQAYARELAEQGFLTITPDAIGFEERNWAIPLLARRIAQTFGDGSTTLHAERLGQAARSVVTSPARWQDWGSPAETLQHIKQLWHVLVRYGRPAAS